MASDGKSWGITVNNKQCVSLVTLRRSQLDTHPFKTFNTTSGQVLNKDNHFLDKPTDRSYICGPGVAISG